MRDNGYKEFRVCRDEFGQDFLSYGPDMWEAWTGDPVVKRAMDARPPTINDRFTAENYGILTFVAQSHGQVMMRDMYGERITFAGGNVCDLVAVDLGYRQNIDRPTTKFEIKRLVIV